MNNLILRGAPALALCLAMLDPARAQGSAAPSATAGSPLQYRSAFADYKPWRDIAPGDWRALNDAVKGDSMPGMDPSGAQGGGGTKAMSPVPGTREMPMPAASAPGHSGHAHARARTASMAAMPGMAPGHDMVGGHP
jgi:hypothetical protein